MTVAYTEMVFYTFGRFSADNVGNLDKARTHVVNVVMRCAVAQSGKEPKCGGTPEASEM